MSPSKAKSKALIFFLSCILLKLLGFNYKNNVKLSVGIEQFLGKSTCVSCRRNIICSVGKTGIKENKRQGYEM